MINDGQRLFNHQSVTRLPLRTPISLPQPNTHDLSGAAGLLFDLKQRYFINGKGNQSELKSRCGNNYFIINLLKLLIDLDSGLTLLRRKGKCFPFKKLFQSPSVPSSFGLVTTFVNRSDRSVLFVDVFGRRSVFGVHQRTTIWETSNGIASLF